jgi:hypothetical protein
METTMQYMLVMCETAERAVERNDPVRAQAYWGAWAAYVEAIGQAGIVVSGAGLELPGTATTVRVRDGRRQVQDGPYADAKEQLGGFFVIEVPSLDAALEWAARSPAAAFGAVEVRPVLPPRSLTA